MSFPMCYGPELTAKALREAETLIAAWRRHYNTVRPHSALGYHPPAPEATPRPVGTCPPSARLGLGPAAVLR